MNRKTKLRTLTIMCGLSACMMFSAISTANALPDTSKCEKSVRLTADAGDMLRFSPDDFSSEGRELSGIIITSLPAPSTGVLSCAGEQVEKGTVIPSESIGALCFRPSSSGDTLAEFVFTPIYRGKGASTDAISVSLWLSDSPNSHPIAASKSFVTYCDMPLCGVLNGVDPDGDSLTYEIASFPQNGRLVLSGSFFTYTPSGEKGDDSFTFRVRDSKGEASSPASVKIETKPRPADKESLFYADMADDPMHYAAVRLAEEGILRGEMIGASSFLRPDSEVSRAEFVSMISALRELPLPTASVYTGMADDGDIPLWAKPCIAAALDSGIVSGEKTASGGTRFRADEAITRAEAAVILSRTLHLPDVGFEADSYCKDLPSWSVQAVANTVEGWYFDKDMPFDEPLTRREAVNALYKAFNALSASKGSFWDIF